MRRSILISILMAVALVTALPACNGGSKIDTPEEPEIEVLIDTTIIVIPTASVTRFNILSHYAWKTEVTSGAYWCHVTPREGGLGGATIAVKCDENDEFMVRQAHIQFKSEGGTGSITVIQQQIDVLDVTADSECSFGPEGGNFAVDVGYNIDYDFTVSSDWVHLTESKALQRSTKLFAVDKNNSGGERTCEVKFAGGDFERTITVTQAAAFIHLSMEDVALEASVDLFPVMVESNIPYTATPQSDGWITVTGEQEAGSEGQQTSAGFELALSENDSWFLREGDVIFGNPDYNISCKLHILQKAVDIIYASLPQFEFGPEGGSFEFDIDPTRTYEFDVDETDWLTLADSDGNPARKVITVAKNLTMEERAAGVTIVRGKARKTLDFSQKSAKPEFSPDRLSFSTGGGETTLVVSGSVNYKLTPPDEAWCTVVKTEDGNYTVTAAPNDTEADRACELVFSNEEYGIRAAVAVVQSQKDVFEITPQALSFAPEGGRAQVDIHANIDYTCEIDAPEWIVEREEERTPQARVYDITLNDTREPRSGHIRFAAEGYDFTATIEQETSFITASEHSYAFDDAAATRTFIVTSNIPCEAKVLGGEWLALDSSQPGAVSFTVEENNDWGHREAQIVLYNDSYPATDTVDIYQGAKFYLDIAQMNFDLPPQESVITIGVTSNKEYEYHIDGNPDWIRETSPLVFEIEHNTGQLARQAQVVFEQNGMSKSVTITQDAPYIMVDPVLLEFTSDGGTGSFSVTTNVDYVLSQPSAGWASWSRDGLASYTVSVPANALTEGRECTIAISSEEFGLDALVEVRQAQLDIFEMENTRIVVSPTGGMVDLGITTNMEYDYSVDCDWVAYYSGFTFTVSKNTTGQPRECEVEFTAGDEPYIITVSQSAPFITTDKQWLDFPVGGGSLTFGISSNIEYEVLLPEDDWIEFALGEDGVYTVTVPGNISDGGRSSAIAIRAVDFDLALTVNLAQEKMDFFEISTTEFAMPPEGGSVQVPLRSNIAYTHTIGQEWVTDGEPLEFIVAANTSSQQRECIIEFSAGENVYPVRITQDAPYLTAGLTPVEFECEGGEATLTISSNVQYRIDGLPDGWISCSGGEGGVYTLTVAENEGFEPRECTLEIVAADFELSSALTLSQKEHLVFEIAETEFAFDCSGGVLELQVRANLEYSMTISEEWITDEGDFRFGVALNDTGQERQGTIEFVCDGETYTVTVTQGAAYLEISQDSAEIGQEGGSFSVTVDSNIPYDVTMPEEEWISVTQGEEGGEYIFEVGENTDHLKRRFEIVFEAGDYSLSRTVSVSQPGVPEPFAFSKRDHYIGPCGGRLEVNHTVCEDINVSLYGNGWIRELEDERTETTLVFDVDSLYATSTRQAVLTVTGDGVTKTAYIFQNPPQLILAYNEPTLPANGGKFNVTLVSNFMPSAFTEDEWVTATVNDSGGLMVLTVAPNDSGFDRTAVIRVGIEAFDYYKEMTISQTSSGRCLVSPDYYEIEGEGGEFFVSVDANVSYSYGSLVPWIRCFATDEEDVIRIKVDPNSSPYQRSSGVEFLYEGMKSYLNIVQEGLRNPAYYYSDDFSRDGNVVRLQQATEGAGIPMVLMGDAYTDRLIEDGTYAADMNRAVEAFFAIEPFASFREFFDIYMVEVVSVNEVYSDETDTALDTYYEPGKMVGGEDATVSRYALSAIRDDDAPRALIIVLMHLEEYGGTTYLYGGGLNTGDYGLGKAISYVPLCTSEDEFTRVLQHEAGGHGFGKLEDEYFYESMGEIPEDTVAEMKKMQRIGFYKNIDFTPDPEQVRWAKFITDEDYQYDGVGVFEGGCGYSFGIYHPTENSMMRLNEGGFNAPSREAIYYRLHKLANGKNWPYDFDAFKEYDAINRVPAPEEEPGEEPGDEPGDEPGVEPEDNPEANPEGQNGGRGAVHRSTPPAGRYKPLPHPILVEK